MANGLVFVKFLYPGHFGLVIPSHYFLKTDEIYGLVRLTRNVQAVDVLDFTNKLILDPGGGDFRTLLNPIDSPGPKVSKLRWLRRRLHRIYLRRSPS
jgi:hypothetical protein